MEAAGDLPGSRLLGISGRKEGFRSFRIIVWISRRGPSPACDIRFRSMDGRWCRCWKRSVPGAVPTFSAWIVLT